MLMDAIERQRLLQLSRRLREAAVTAVSVGSGLAGLLDESRLELERLLMLASCDNGERRRIVIRANMILDVWQGLAGRAPARSAARQ
jgi:hypothetical protein